MSHSRWRSIPLTVAATGTLLVAAISPAAAPAGAAPTDLVAAETSAPYLVSDVTTLEQRNRIAASGASLDGVEHGVADITATPSEVASLRQQGFTVTRALRPATPGGPATVQDFPSADSAYHNYAELTAELDQAVADHPAILSRTSLGTSYEGRSIPVIKISDNVGVDENEPEVIYTAHQHAREHLTVEMALYLIKQLTDNYGTDPRITAVVDSREIWIVPDMNPDGGEYDIATGSYRSWRKNRQPNSGSSNVGTDLNRNWAYNFGCCGGSSGTTSSETYRGPSAFSAPETSRVRDFVLSRRVGGVQQIRTHIDFHTYGKLVLWPFGYTTANTAPGLDADQEATFRTLGVQLAGTNGYTPEQASDLYITDGSIDDWMWGDQRIWSYTFEMYPGSSGGGGFYPPDEVIAAQTALNREASLQIAEYADCPYRVIGKEAQYCGAGQGTTVWSDDFESNLGWTVNPSGTDTATSGAWERGDPEATDSSGPKQLGTTVSGSNDLVTARLAGASAGANDVDGGTTSVRSPSVTLPSTGTLTLTWSWYLGHGSNASSADFLRVSVVTGSGTTVLFTAAGAATDRDASWATASANLTPYAGQTVRILVEAADASTASLVEAGVDNVTIRQT
ncbi:zinc carboxypeptidase [Dactylosporangium aurantiacum]|uniref:Zinc carboxypeptidase n=1 Tax=Dactylosporangium aurantiacum TaxID=35754 RepID=A0A9Q9I9P0_9ACTN|nr:M14 family zinc carboxypeptidase [Dactylosporangium aurantiacum]MDG6101768.1 M14 family zinc carboxypeptidase [Dactylosporangium aurantiacum]UWZ52424.1 zinc carboxypeptidase [Dactylosporangium aurantiacum]